MTTPERNYVVALDHFTNRNTGLCYPSQQTIAEKTGLSRSRQQEGRKRCLARKIFSIEMRKVNRKGNAVTHFIWQSESWKSASITALEPRPNFDRTPTQFYSNPDPILDGGGDQKGGVHMKHPDPKRDGVTVPKPLTKPLFNPSAPHPLYPKEKREQEVERALRAGQNPNDREHSDEYWAYVRTLKAQGVEGEALTAAMEKWGLK